MPSPQFPHVIETIEQLESSIDHMNTKWDLFYSQGFLPETGVFNELKKKVTKLKINLELTRNIFMWLINQGISDKLILKDNKYTLVKVKKINKLLFKNNLSIDDIEELEKSDLKTKIKMLNNITNKLYYDVETISDMLNALNYGFISRVSGVFSPETTFSKDIATKKFGGVQLVYDAAETLMKDYVESFFGENYNGLVLFGFRNRAVAYPTSLVVFPAYSEYDLEFLTILSHESFHSIQDSLKEKFNERKEKYQPKTIIEEKMVEIKKEIRHELIWLADIYRNEDYREKNIPAKIVAESLAHELMADIYATYIAGDSYPLMLYNYYLPILFNIESGYCSRYDYSTFSVGSLKLRVSLLALNEIFKLHNYDPKELKLKIHGKDLDYFDYFFNEINKWENLSINLARLQLRDKYKKRNKVNRPDIHDKEIMVKSDGKDILVKDEILRICNEIEKKRIIEKMSNLISQPYYPDMSLKQFEANISKIHDIFNGSPTHKQIIDVWRNNSWFKPKHLISILAKYPTINRNAILISLAYHENIISRFR